MPIISLHYPETETAPFDFAYYRDHHLPMVEQLWGTLLERVEVLQGVAGLSPGSTPAYAAITLLYFATDADMQRALTHPDAVLLQQDLRNFAQVEPVVQINTARGA